MKKVLCSLLALVVLAALALPVLAAGDDFVPSITYKDAPEIVVTEDELGNEIAAIVRNEAGEVVDYVYTAELVSSSVAKIEESEKLTADEKTLLRNVYNKITSGEMKLPYEKVESVKEQTMVIRDLIYITIRDVSPLSDSDVVEVTLLSNEKTRWEISFNLGVEANTNVVAMTYNNNEWTPAHKVVNNGDGTVTCTLDNLGVLALSVPAVVNVPAEPTPAPDYTIWIIAGAAAAVVLVIIIVIATRKKKDEE